MFLVPKQHNAKGIGLFLQGYCNLLKIVTKDNTLASTIGTKEQILEKIHYLSDLLISMQSKGYHGACWGYNFDWQSRRLFLFPAYCPTVVATCFCASALFEAYELTKKKEYLDVALDSANFILKDLHFDDYKGEKMISYSPLQGNYLVSNASLLGSKVLAYCYKYTKKDEYLEIARSSVKACCLGQAEDGSWTYSQVPPKQWIDSFHTGYNLDGLMAYEKLTGDKSFHDNIEKGFDFYIKNFFNEDGSPKYYHNEQYPIDIHCPGQLLVTLHSLNKYDDYYHLADKVLEWTIKNMQDEKGYFYYQIKKSKNSKIPYMRWSNAFMFYAMSYYLLNK
jgi:rhamnogalacturonyl hydrolase YesR